ncbi:inorganic phosphate transporter [Allobranchiibius sp. GilTou73]|uniref:inorganic phosphate transporter n=1 Tax=Allobranchiibius sp. GilTou73 TaxID=2904523 RepID=UPI001F297E47|nr:inorganic phosphate transporter [Allobranchiibius sp. GilTou73]UIJ33478.1 inorganic phosphate transporter [Allobranchiibius sp. GilTou73]
MSAHAQEVVVLVLVVVTALGFDFTNGFHDTGNAMATSIATGALKPKVAVAISGLLNLVGAFLSVEVATTVTTSVLKIQQKGSGNLLGGITAETALIIIFAGLVGGILWNLFTWLHGLPSSSSHALFGGLIGAGLASGGLSRINWDGLVSKVLLPAVASPFVAGIVAAIGTFLIYAITRSVRDSEKESSFRWGQIGTASLVSLAHGTGDAQKTMGVIALALIAKGSLTSGDIMKNGIPIWIIFSCGAAIALGTYLGGWRVIRTLGKGLVDIDAPQGMAAEASSAAIILTSSHFGMALSTTHVASGSIVGTGLGRPNSQVRWSVAGRMAAGWVLTLPCAAIVGAACYGVAHLIGGVGGAVVIFIVLLSAAGYMYLRSRATAVHAGNVNDEWEGAPSVRSELSERQPAA